MKLSTILVLVAIALLSACAKQDNPSISKQPDRIENQGSFREVPASQLLDDSRILDYPDDFPFVPTFLGDDGLAYGYSIDEEASKSSLVYLDTKTNNYAILKTVDYDQAPVVFGTYYADEDYTVFHEYHYETQFSSYYLWDKKTNSTLEIMSATGVPPLHLTEVARWKETFILITSDSQGNYPINAYNRLTQETKVLEGQNSGYPVVVDDVLYYILLDNERLKTKLVRYDLLSDDKKVLSETDGEDEFYNGIYSHDANLLVVKQSEEAVSFLRGYEEESTELLKVDYAETIVCRNGYLSFLGTNRYSADGRMHYYLFDLKERINYIYEDKVLYLSEIGILWVETLKPETEIPVGKIFSKENSRIRFLPFH